MEIVDKEWLAARLTGKRGEQARIAEALGIGAPEVSKIISGVRRIQPDEIFKLKEFFGEGLVSLTPEEMRILQKYREAPDSRREAAEALLSAPPKSP